MPSSESRGRRVLIVGAGIAGLTAAYWLGRDDVEVHVAERASVRPRRGYVVTAFGQCLDILRAMELGDDVDAIRLPLDTTVGLRSDGSTHYRRDLSDITDGSRGIAAFRSDLADILEDAATRVPSVAIRRGCCVQDLTFADGHAEVVFDTDGSSARYDLVIAADGVHSATRERYVAPDTARVLPARFLGATTSDTIGLEAGTRYEYCEVGANVVLVPSGRGEATIVMFGRDDYLSLGDTSEDHADTLRRVARSWPEPLKSIAGSTTAGSQVFADDLVQVLAPRWSQDRLVLVGDAAACMSPLSGRGVDAAITGAYVLAEELLAEPIDWASGLRRYEQRLRPEIQRLQTTAAKRVSLSAPRTRLQVAGLRASMKYTPEALFRRMVERQFTNPLVPTLDPQRLATAD